MSSLQDLLRSYFKREALALALPSKGCAMILLMSTLLASPLAPMDGAPPVGCNILSNWPLLRRLGGAAARLIPTNEVGPLSFPAFTSPSSPCSMIATAKTHRAYCMD